jgi:carboxypeptidase Taq
LGEKFDALSRKLREIRNLQKAASVLIWDQETKMPPGGSRARAEQLSTLSHLTHTMFTADAIGEMLSSAREEIQGLPYDSDDASLIRVAQRDYEQSKKVPADLVAEMTRHIALSHHIWVQARREDDYPAFAPCLSKTLELSRRRAEYLGYQEKPYDALLDLFEPGMRSSKVAQIFDKLKGEIIPLVRAITEKADRVSDEPVHRSFDEVKQEEFGVMVAAALGYDFSRGRQDRAVHPFETSFSRNDVRITTRFERDFLNPSLFGTMHESGHAMYEQGIGEGLEGTLLGRGASSALHESQSRLWENVVGRSRRFWQYFYPQLQEKFPEVLNDVDLDAFYRAINKIEPSLIRVEADEVTYTLHVMLRFEMEMALFEGSISVQDASLAWKERHQQYLGVAPPNDRLGILQDIHWSSGLLGYFPTYALGTMLSLQLYNCALQAHPGIPDEIEHGRFDTLRSWLTEKVYRHGRKYEPLELIERVTGQQIQTEPYVAYLKAKFGEIYGLGAI